MRIRIVPTCSYKVFYNNIIPYNIYPVKPLRILQIVNDENAFIKFLVFIIIIILWIINDIPVTRQNGGEIIFILYIITIVI